MGSLADDSSRRPVGDRRTPAATSPRLSHGDQRRTIGHRNCFAALVFMARTSTPWRFLPAQKLGCGSPATAWRRLMSGARAGVFDRLHLEVLDRLALAGRLDWSRASVDSASVGAKRGGPRGRRSRRSWQAGVQAPLRQRAPRPAADRRVTAANAGDTSVFEALCDDVAAVLIPDRRRRSRPGKLDADKVYDNAANGPIFAVVGIKARIGRRGIESSSQPGRQRWRIERTLSWLSCYRRLAVRWDQGPWCGRAEASWPGRCRSGSW